MAEWIPFLTGQLSEKETESLLSQGAEDLRAFLESHPRAERHVLDILGRRLEGPVDPGTWQVIDASLVTYLGRDLAYLLTWIAQGEGETALQELAQYASPEVMGFVRAILSHYGPELANAIALWNEHPDDWRTIYREVYYDQIGERHLVRVRIEKYNGQEITIEGSPDSLLNLTTYILLTLRLVGTPDAFTADSVARFADEVDQFDQLLFPEEDEEDLDRVN